LSDENKQAEVLSAFQAIQSNPLNITSLYVTIRLLSHKFLSPTNACSNQWALTSVIVTPPIIIYRLMSTRFLSPMALIASFNITK